MKKEQLEKLLEVPEWAEIAVIPLLLILIKKDITFFVKSRNSVYVAIRIKNPIQGFSVFYDYIVQLENNKFDICIDGRVLASNCYNDQLFNMYDSKQILVSIGLNSDDFNKDEIVKDYENWKLNNRGLISAKNLGLV